MSQSLSEDQRAAIRQMARDTADREGGLSDFDRDLVGWSKTRIDIPLRDTQEVARALTTLAAAIDRCRVILSHKVRDERGSLLAVRGLLREANKKVNAYRRIRAD